MIRSRIRTSYAIDKSYGSRHPRRAVLPSVLVPPGAGLPPAVPVGPTDDLQIYPTWASLASPFCYAVANMKHFLLLCLLLSTAACATQAGPIAAGVVGGLAVLDQLLAAGVLDPVQHFQLSGALRDAATLAQQATTVAQQAQQAADALRAGTLTTEEGVGLASGITAAGVAALNLYRNATRRAATAPPAS